LVVFGALVGVLSLMQLRIMENLQQKYLFDPPLSLRFDYPK
jgi:hypothetical protein